MDLPSYDIKDKVFMAVDCIIFGFDGDDLKILLVKRKFDPEIGKWSLIGGFMKQDEDLDQAASRILYHLTGLDNVYMEQLHTYSRVDRDPQDRTLSVAYFALIDINGHGKLHWDAVKWFDIKKAPRPIFDHPQMIEKALARLRRRALGKPIGFELLPEKFTMRQLRTLYEVILDRELDKRNFINKVNSLDILQKLDEKDKTVSRKGAYLYRFDKDKYDRKVGEGFNFKL